MTIKYRLAVPGGEYNKLYALMKREGGKRVALGWPTVVAEENGEVVGFVGTYPREDALVAGPLVIKGSKRPWVFLRLAEAYEVILRTAGVKLYFHTIDKLQPDHVEFMERLGFSRAWETDDSVVMKRELN